MHGDVWEWCTDDWHESYDGAPQNGTSWLSEFSSKKVIRGGSGSFSPWYCRSAFRLDYNRSDRLADIGFRVVYVDPRTT